MLRNVFSCCFVYSTLSFLYLLLQITNSSEDQAGAEVVTAVVEVVRVMVTVIEGVDITTEEDTGVVTGVETGVETDMTLHLVTVMVVALIGAAEDVVDLEAVVVSLMCVLTSTTFTRIQHNIEVHVSPLVTQSLHLHVYGNWCFKPYQIMFTVAPESFFNVVFVYNSMAISPTNNKLPHHTRS